MFSVTFFNYLHNLFQNQVVFKLIIILSFLVFLIHIIFQIICANYVLFLIYDSF